MKTSENIQDIAKALSLAQADIKPASKDGANPHFKCKFSTLASAWEAIRIPVTSQGITIIQDVTTEERSIVSVVTRAIHTSGQWIEFGPLCIPLSKQDAQAIGSAISYAKRYALCAALGIVSSDDDDDGEAAMDRQKPYESQKMPPLQKLNSVHLNVLKKLNDKLDQDCRDRLFSWINSTFKASSLEDLAVDVYPKVLAAFENAAKFMEQQKIEALNGEKVHA